MWNVKAEATCKNAPIYENEFRCSRCDAHMDINIEDSFYMIVPDVDTPGQTKVLMVPNYCPNCGARVMEE